MGSFVVTTLGTNTEVLTLPFDRPLAEWQDERIVYVPRGISRHIVRFVDVGGEVFAVKEATDRFVLREHQLLRSLAEHSVPVVEAYGTVIERTNDDGEELGGLLITRHLPFSQPYRSLFTGRSLPQLRIRLLDALAGLFVRLHLAGFYWGDCSLSNTLFRRDAGALAAYLVDAETGELRDSLSDGQREHDLEIARVNIAGELMDLSAGGFLPESVDPVDTSQRIVDRYRDLWRELTEPERFEQGDRWRVDERIRRLNELGFDVDELAISTDIGGTQIQIQPKVVDAGHHSRRLLRLTGLDVEENQARRLLNDLDAYRAATDRQGDDEEIVAHDWLSRVYEPVQREVPRDLTHKLEPAELFHEVLEHRWYMSERAGHDVSIEAAIKDYVAHVLPGKPDESAVVGVDTVEMPIVARVSGPPHRRR